MPPVANVRSLQSCAVPVARISLLRDLRVNADGRFVLYWMTAARRVRSNFALQRAAELAVEHGKPLVVLEALRSGYEWASDRLHQFVIDGMRDNAVALERSPALYYPYLEPRDGDGKGLLETLAADASAVVTDDYSAFFVPQMLAAVAPRLDVRLEAVDANGLLPMRGPDRAFVSAHQFRRHLQRELPQHLEAFPCPDPLADPRVDVPIPRLDPAALADFFRRWPRADLERVELAAFAIDHSVPLAPLTGGAVAARERLRSFVANRLATYGQGRNHPDDDAASGLSPYLHFGHIGAHEVVAAVLEHERWSPSQLADNTSGRRAGWWGLSSGAESFLDEVVTWRELGFNACVADPDGYDRLDSIPDWAQRTLTEHAGDAREQIYELDELADAATDDEVWNAAQRQLRREGRIHNYLRMLWGKRIVAWTATPQDALDTMVELNNRYALDGRDPNSYSGILWCLGKFDRAWGPERPIYGKVRYMSSENTRRKLRMSDYLARFAPE